MHYVKYFDINGVATKQVACIELQGAPNAATEGAVGVLGMDMSSPTHEVYRCVAVNGSIYTWELLSAGMSVLSATITREGAMSTSFAYTNLKIPNNYLIKAGDLVLDVDGYVYQVTAIGGESCEATYTGTHLGGAGTSEKDCRLVVNNGKLQLVTESGNVLSELDYITSDESTIHRDPSTGVASVIGVRTVDGGLLHIFVGTQAQYDTLTEDQKQNLFAIISDDGKAEEFQNILDGVQVVPKAASAAQLSLGAPVLNAEKKLTETGYYYIRVGNYLSASVVYWRTTETHTLKIPLNVVVWGVDSHRVEAVVLIINTDGTMEVQLSAYNSSTGKNESETLDWNIYTVKIGE